MLVLAATALISCNEDKKEVQKDYAVISGSIKEPIENRKIRLYDYENQKSVIIEVDKDGNFRDTLKLENPTVYNASYRSIFPLYLRNGMDLNLKFKDSTSKPEATGEGSTSFKVLQEKNKLMASLFDDYKAFFSRPEAEFRKDMDEYNEDFKNLLESNKDELDSAFVNSQEKSLEGFNKQMNSEFERYEEINAKLAAGTPSPDFQDYINYDGGTSSLSDITGNKHIYIDMWATWCGPCKYEIPFLKELEEEYEDKDIKFVSISIDARKDEDKWRQMIKDKELTGTQLLADKEYQSQFVQDYYIQGIPRFIILDPQGNIVDYDAPRPSEPRLKEVLNGLDI
ncbi:Thiol-disulfide isomerase or thioredoxin [Salegentibacter echinorum]|uniref:Thiol-disulfide isomerase or thioredoxin n=2 Tax=Salegentibacter echinorum TaxID=1073325 RepID=A0A1M5E3I1_SALEC|nr:Thiol-disulfide isomerase or thioredoxin [Salegentibacter echinorum]